jgi:hypothetical protein
MYLDFFGICTHAPTNVCVKDIGSWASMVLTSKLPKFYRTGTDFKHDSLYVSRALKWQKSLSDIQQRFSCLLDERIGKKSKNFFFAVAFF